MFWSNFGWLNLFYAIIIGYTNTDNIGLISSALICFIVAIVSGITHVLIEKKKEEIWIRDNQHIINKVERAITKFINEP